MAQSKHYAWGFLCHRLMNTVVAFLCERLLSLCGLCLRRFLLRFMFPQSPQYVFVYHFNGPEHSGLMWLYNMNSLHEICTKCARCVCVCYGVCRCVLCKATYSIRQMCVLSTITTLIVCSTEGSRGKTMGS